MKKSNDRTKGKTLKNQRHGIPKVLETIHYEKISETIPVKVQFSLKKFMKQNAGKQGVSAWIREAIIMRLKDEGERNE